MIHKLLIAVATILISFGSLSVGANAAITLVPVGAREVDIANVLGNDSFRLFTRNRRTAFFFGNSDLSGNLDTANRVPLDALDAQQYFQVDTAVPSILGTPAGSSRAYFFDSMPYAGGTDGLNFSVYDTDQNGVSDTVFLLDFGPSIIDFSDDFIVAYAFDSSPSGIDISSARDALTSLEPSLPRPSIPEPSIALLFALGALGLVAARRRNVWVESGR